MGKQQSIRRAGDTTLAPKRDEFFRRYVPKRLDKLEQVCADIKGATRQLLQFYQEFMPLIPQKRGNESSPHCMKMLERAIRKFTAAGLRPQAQAFETQLARLKASEGK